MGNKLATAGSSQLTGGEGFTYEDVVGAYFLTALLREEAALGLPGHVMSVAVQQDRQGEPMDDVIVDSEVDADRHRLSLQVKRSVTISKSNDDFKQIIVNAVATRAKTNFRSGFDRYGFVARAVGDGRLQSLQRIIDRAKASPTGAQFVSRFEPAGESSKDDIALRNDLKVLIQPADADAEADFYRHFVAYRLDNLETGGDRFTDLTNRLSAVSAAGDGPGLMEIVARQVRVGEGTAKVWKRASLIADLRTLHPLAVAPSYAADVCILVELARNSAADIRSDIRGVTIPRHKLVDSAEDTAASHIFSNVNGLPGCGKSVVLKRCVERALVKGPTLFLMSDRLHGSTWRAFAHALGLRHQAPAEILSEIGATGSPVLFIDGIDRIKTEQRGIVMDLIHAIQSDTSLQHWRILVTSRDQGLEVLRSWIPGALYAATGLGTITVGILDDDEAEDLAQQRPELRPLLFGAPAVMDIARRPFFAAVLADQAAGMALDAKAPPQTESELIEAWWIAGGYNVPSEEADLRQRALLNLAEIGAVSLGKDIRGRQLEADTRAQLADLRRDKIIDQVVAGTSYKFSHDIFFEWSFFRLLIDRGNDWPEALVAAGEPPLLARIVGLLSQHVFEDGGDWSAIYQALTARPLRPQWRRAWLLGPSASAHFTKHRGIFEGLLFADDYALLSKFLVWFQAERTIPNPLILQNSTSLLEGSALIRAADQWGWPSDVPAWQRVLIWVLVRHEEFPPAATPLAAELFAVWQNMAGDIANPVSERIVALAEIWLLDLEDGASPRWTGLRDKTTGALATALRNLILRSARAYPDPAQRLIDRVMKLKRRGELFQLVVAFSSVFAQALPEKLAELVLTEVVEPLPLDEVAEEKRARVEGNARRAAVRAKPEAERTEHDNHVLNGMFMALGSKTYDFDDTGIDRMHSAFYPPSPAHEPFASLFKYAPDVALKLARDLANRATTAWRQIHEINAPRFGTPIPIEIDFPWGRQRFWGNQRVYSWFFGQGGPQPLEAAFLTMAHWAHQRLDEGDDVDELIRKVVEGQDSVAALGLAVSLAITKRERSPALLSLLSIQRLWFLDFRRQIEESAREVKIFGIDLQQRMGTLQRQADDYLLGREYRKHSLKDLAYLYALSPNKDDQKQFRKALQQFPKNLPYELEEERSDKATTAVLKERAEGWSKIWKPSNYGWTKLKDQPGMAQLEYRDPDPLPPAQQQRQENAQNHLIETSVYVWASKSFEEGKINDRLSLEQALQFAKTRDHEDLFEQIAEASAMMTQSCVVGAAAMAIRFGDNASNKDWAWSIFARLDGISEPEGVFRYAPNPFDPRFLIIATLRVDLISGSPRSDSASRLLRFAGDPNPQIAQGAFIILLGAIGLPADLTWNGAVLASDLFVAQRTFSEDGTRDPAVQEAYRAAAMARAIGRLEGTQSVPDRLTPPPCAWVYQQPVGRFARSGLTEERWMHPEADFDPYFARELIVHLPVSSWAASQHRDALLEYADDLVRWTADRLFPAWDDGKDKERHGTQLYEWLTALAKFISRIVTLVPNGYDRYIAPIASHKSRDAIYFLNDVVDTTTRRHVYDAAALPEEALQVLEACMDRMLTEGVFSPTSYRAGEVDTHEFHSMVTSFLLTSATKCPGAARFANGDWKDLPRLMPLIDKLMLAAGWSADVMNAYLTLCEQAGALFPIDVFSRHIATALDAPGFRQERWNSSGTSAGVSTAIQQLAELHGPLSREHARSLLILLDRLVDMGDRRAAALQQSEHFRSIQLAA